MRKPFVMGNWKLNGSNSLTDTLIADLRVRLDNVESGDVAIAPPLVYLHRGHQALSGSRIALGAQNVDINLSGAFTGEVSAEMLKDSGARYVIIGHSERRTYHLESNDIIAKKFGLLKTAGLIPVLCIGETESENSAGNTETICASQIDAVLNTLGVTAFRDAVIAYEPVWAIGTGKSATPEQAQKVHQFIRRHVARHNEEIASQLIIQYGGSVNDKNAALLFAQPDIDGALVGGASLQADVFTVIVNAATAAKRA